MVSDALFRTGHLMTGNAADAEDLIQETLLRVARRWNRVRAMDHPAGYARRIMVNLALRGAGRRSRPPHPFSRQPALPAMASRAATSGRSLNMPGNESSAAGALTR